MNRINYVDLCDLPIKKNKITILSFCIILLLLFILCNYKVYSVYKFSAVAYGSEVIVSIPISDLNVFYKSNYILIDENEKKHNYKILSFGEIYLNNGVYYQDINIEIDKKFLKNQIVSFKIIYDCERVIKKIQKIIV